MRKTSKPAVSWAVFLFAGLLALAGGCTQGSDSSSMEDKYASALAELNPDWVLYEIGESRGAVTIKVESQEIVNFQDAKKAVEAIQKVDPQFKGYLDFFDSKTGTVVRKIEIIPAAPTVAPAN